VDSAFGIHPIVPILRRYAIRGVSTNERIAGRSAVGGLRGPTGSELRIPDQLLRLAVRVRQRAGPERCEGGAERTIDRRRSDQPLVGGVPGDARRRQAAPVPQGAIPPRCGIVFEPEVFGYSC